MIIITGTTGTPHITPKQDAMWHRGLMGASTCIFEEGRIFEPEIMNNSTVRIYDGVCSVQGRFMCIEPETYDEVTIDNGTQGQKRIDIICGKLTIGNDGKSTASIEAIKGTPSASTPAEPTVPETDLDGEDRVAYIPLVKVELDGVVLEAATFIGDIYTQNSRMVLWTNDDGFKSGTIDLPSLSKYEALEIEFLAFSARPIVYKLLLRPYNFSSSNYPQGWVEQSDFYEYTAQTPLAVQTFIKEFEVYPAQNKIRFHNISYIRRFVATTTSPSYVQQIVGWRVDDNAYNAMIVPTRIYGIK